MLRACLLASTCLALALGLTGCADAMCDPKPVGDAWKPYESLLPGNAVVCGPNRTSSVKPSDVVDNYPPTHVFVFYKDANAPTAFDQTLKKFESAGWAVADLQIHGEGEAGLYHGEVTKDGDKIQFDVNRNDWGIQGSFELSRPK